MKKGFKNWNILIGLILFVVNGQAQSDITGHILTNAGFDTLFNFNATDAASNLVSANQGANIKQVYGWNIVSIGDNSAAASYEYGYAGTLNSQPVPATGYNNSTGGALGISSAWSATNAYGQEIVLPAGSYVLEYAAYNSGPTDVDYSRVGWIPQTGNPVLSSKTSFTVSDWNIETVAFELAAFSQGVIQAGIAAPNSGSAAVGRIFFDYIKVTCNSIDKTRLTELVAEGNALYNDNSTDDRLKAALDAVDAVIDEDAASPALINAAVNLGYAVALAGKEAELGELLDRALELLNGDTSIYSQAAVDALQAISEEILEATAAGTLAFDNIADYMTRLQSAIDNYLASALGLKIQYTFDDITGNTVKNKAGDGYNGTLRNEVSVIAMGKYKVLQLGNGSGYLDMGAAAGNILPSATDFTISAYYRIAGDASLSGNGYFLWAFSVLEANGASAGPYVAYRLNAQRFALSTGGYSNEAGIQVGAASAKNEWQHVVYRQTGRTGELYINGQLAGQATNVPLATAAFTAPAQYNWIGRAPFSGDNYLKNTMVYDFRFYNQAVSSDSIAEWAGLLAELNDEYNHGTRGDFSQLIALIAQCNAFLSSATIGDNRDEYPQAAAWELQDAILPAQECVTENIASQFVIDEQIANLQTAYAKFLASKNTADSNTDLTNGKSDSAGFVHPGALHTQADFDRIKALLQANDPTVKAAWNRLCANSFASENYAPNPQTKIIRGSGYPENYAIAFRDIAAAYQNALRWKIAGTKANADKAVQILNGWAKTCTSIEGSPDTGLALGIYGYEFANAAELMRDYEGWLAADFKKFQKWMLTLWYPGNINFNRTRWGQWQGNNNPGHHWSNWGLCNVLSLLSIGILCDDVFIYNQGVSYFKYDMVGTFRNDTIAPKKNDGCNEFIGNLVVCVFPDERGPYGGIGQMQESGRDQGHAAMACGLSVDAAQIMWSQGDDAFAYMDNRLAAGIYWTALGIAEGAENLPWAEYWYRAQNQGYPGWIQSVPASGGAQFRPYWDRVIGHYEGIKGVDMPAAHVARDVEPIDGGGGHYGPNSGGFDHLGFSTLTCYRPQKAHPLEVPYTLVPYIIYDGKTLNQSELGGLRNTYSVDVKTTVPVGKTITLSPQLPADATDDGTWRWDSGETTREITFVTEKSGMYRVTYTAASGTKSVQLFSIAVAGDCTPDVMTPRIIINGVVYSDTIITVAPRTPFTLSLIASGGFGTYKWNNNATTSSITINNISSDRTYSVIHTTQGGTISKTNFHIKLSSISPSLSIDGGEALETDKAAINAGQSVELKPVVQPGSEGGVWSWSNGSSAQNLLLENIQENQLHSVTYTFDGEEYRLDFNIRIIVRDKEVINGDYFIKNASNGRYLTNNGSSPVFDDLSGSNPETQAWTITKDGTRYKITSKSDNRFLNENGVFTTNVYNKAFNTYALHGTDDSNLYAIQNGGSAGTNYWTINADGTVKGKGSTTINDFPFEIVPYQSTGMSNIKEGKHLIYPNPATDFLRIKILGETVESNTVTIYSLTGKSLKKQLFAPSGEILLDISDIPGGVYFCSVQNSRDCCTYKFVKNGE